MKRFTALLAMALSTLLLAVNPAAASDPHAGMGRAAPKLDLMTQEGTVLSSIDQSQYTYIEVSQNKKSLWLATTRVAVRKGDRIRFDEGMVMTNFHSKGLNRTFPSIAFVSHVAVSNSKK